MNKRGYEFSFVWIFAVIVGAFIIALAIFAANKLIDTQRLGTESGRGKQIGILLNPVETNLEQTRITKITVSDATRIFNKCSSSGIFGAQEISTSIKSGIGEEWRAQEGVASSFHNKYLFSSSVVEGEEEFYLLSKPFQFPFKVADFIILWSDKENYCFVKPFDEIEAELTSLKPENIVVESNIANCLPESIKVCFSVRNAECSLEVSQSGDIGRVYNKETGKTFYYVTSFNDDNKFPMLYAAIFSSDLVNYDCQISRTMHRAAELAKVYNSKSAYLTQKGCGSLIQSDLSVYQNKVQSISTSEALANPDILDSAKNVGDKNDKLASSCRLF